MNVHSDAKLTLTITCHTDASQVVFTYVRTYAVSKGLFALFMAKRKAGAYLDGARLCRKTRFRYYIRVVFVPTLTYSRFQGKKTDACSFRSP